MAVPPNDFFLACGRDGCDGMLDLTDVRAQIRAGEEIDLKCPACGYYTLFREGKRVAYLIPPAPTFWVGNNTG